MYASTPTPAASTQAPVAQTYQDGNNQGQGSSAYQSWLRTHPNAPSIEKDVMKKALSAGSVVTPAVQSQPAAPTQAETQAATSTPVTPAPKQAAMGRALGTA